MKHFEYGLAVERQAATQLALVLAKRILALAGKDWAVLDNHLGVVERHALHGDRSTLKADLLLRRINIQRSRTNPSLGRGAEILPPESVLGR